MTSGDPGPEPFYLLSIIGVLCFFYVYFMLLRRSVEVLYPHRIYRILGASEDNDAGEEIPKSLRDPNRLLFSFRWLGMACLIGLIVIAAGFEGLPHPSDTREILAATALFFGVFFLLGQLAPALILRFFSDGAYRQLIKALYLTERLTMPLTRPLYRVWVFVGGKEVPFSEDNVAEPEDEVKAYLEASAQAGVIEKSENEMIQRVMELDETPVRGVMTPRTEIIGIEVNSTLEEVREIVNETKKSRYPVYEETIDNIIGVFYVKNMIKFWGNKEETFDLREVCKDPYFIPDSKVVTELLNEFRSEKIHIAFLVDEYGGINGLVTIEDLLEEIVGEIEDEYDMSRAQTVVPFKGGGYLINARADVEELEELLDLEIEHEDFDSVGGFVLQMCEKVPEEGEFFEYQGWRFTIYAADGKRVHQVLIQPVSSPKATKPRNTENGNGFIAISDYVKRPASASGNK